MNLAARLLITLICSSFVFIEAQAQDRATQVEDATSRLDESDNATLLKTNKLADPVTGDTQYRQIDPAALEKRVVVSRPAPPGDEERGGFLCPDGTNAACLDTGDKVCPDSARCVGDQATCFDAFPCGLNEGFVCASEYDDMLDKLRQVAKQHDELATENVALRQHRLEQRNCVINAQSLKEAIGCVRKS